MDDNVMRSTNKEMKARSRRGRQRIEIKKIEDESKRQVTFSKRRKGLFKKAKELSALCGVQVGILAVSKSGRVYTTDDIDEVLETKPSFNGLLQKQNEEEEEDEKLMEYRVALMELREKAAVRLEEDLVNQLMTEQGIYEWAL